MATYSAKTIGAERTVFESCKNGWTNDIYPTVVDVVAKWKAQNDTITNYWKGPDQKAYSDECNDIFRAIELYDTAIEEVMTHLTTVMEKLEAEAQEAAGRN